MPWLSVMRNDSCDAAVHDAWCFSKHARHFSATLPTATGNKVSGGYMRGTTRSSLWVAVVVLFSSTMINAADAGFSGTVTNAAGKPIRGALVKASAGAKTITKFTQADGKYEITLVPGTYDVAVEAYGYDPKVQAALDTTKNHNLNFQLAPGFSRMRLTNAEIQGLLPENTETKFIRRECIACHSFGTIQNKAGFTAPEWQEFIPNMPQGRTGIPAFIPHQPGPKMTYLTQNLEKYFGTKAPYFGEDTARVKPSDVHHVEMTDTALKGTFTEYLLPSGEDSYAHSILISKKGDAWFSELGQRANKIARFDMETEKFYTYPARMPHTGAEGKDGRIWFSLVDNPDLGVVDPDTGLVETYKIPDHVGPGTHTVAVDNNGNIWCSGASAWKFDVKTKKFTEYKVPLPPVYPKNSILAWGQSPDETPEIVLKTQNDNLLFYDVKVDSKNNVWLSAYSYGQLIRINADTGEIKVFPVQDTPSIRGIAVDENDIVWFANFNGNALGRLDPKTGESTLFHPPTKFAMPYGIYADKKRRKIWFSDLGGNNITMFDPKTEKFSEYLVPTNNASLHFISQDERGRIWFTELMKGKIAMLDPGQ
jgi:virginiamycin B lyase